MFSNRLPPKNFMISFLIYWLLAERFPSGKRFRQDFYPHSAFSSFSCFKNTFFGNFLLWTDGNLSSPWGMTELLSSLPGRKECLEKSGENSPYFLFYQVRFKLSSLPGGLESLFSPWENGSRQIFLPKSKVSLEVHIWGYVKKATRKQRFAPYVHMDFRWFFSTSVRCFSPWELRSPGSFAP